MGTAGGGAGRATRRGGPVWWRESLWGGGGGWRGVGSKENFRFLIFDLRFWEKAGLRQDSVSFWKKARGGALRHRSGQAGF